MAVGSLTPESPLLAGKLATPAVCPGTMARGRYIAAATAVILRFAVFRSCERSTLAACTVRIQIRAGSRRRISGDTVIQR